MFLFFSFLLTTQDILFHVFFFNFGQRGVWEQFNQAPAELEELDAEIHAMQARADTMYQVDEQASPHAHTPHTYKRTRSTRQPLCNVKTQQILDQERVRNRQPLKLD